MFLAFTAAAMVAGAFAQLGALAVKVSMLTIALKCLAVVAVVATLVAVCALFLDGRR